MIAALGVVADALAYGSSSYIAHPVLKALVVILMALAFYSIAVLIRRSSVNNRKALLLPPPDLLGGKLESELNDKMPNGRPKTD